MNDSKDLFDDNKYKIDRLEYDDNYTYKDIFNVIMKSLGCEKTVIKKFKDEKGKDIDPKFCKTADRCNGKYFWSSEKIRGKVDFMISQALGQNSQQVPILPNLQTGKLNNDQSKILYEQATFAKNLFIVIDFLSGSDYEFKYIFLLIDRYLDDKIDYWDTNTDDPSSESSEADLHYKYLLELAYKYFHDVLQFLSEEKGNKSYPTLLKNRFEEELKCDPYYTNIYLFLIKNNSSDIEISHLLFKDNIINNFEDADSANIAKLVKDFVDNVCGYISKECSSLPYSQLINSVKSYLYKKYPKFFSYNLNPRINEKQFVEALVDSLFENQYLEICYKFTSINDFTNEKTGWLVHWEQYEDKVKKELFSILLRREQLKPVKNNPDINNDRLKKYDAVINGLNGLSIREFYILILQGLKSEGFELD